MFRDRGHAGRQLADQLKPYRDKRVLVLALPRGGVPVGYEVARVLGARLDVIVARKLGAPQQPELGIGAVAPGVRVLDERLVQRLKVPAAYLDAITDLEMKESKRREELYRGDRPMYEVAAQTVILVDDGLATGVTARAAIESIRRQRPARVILAVPVCPRDTASALRQRADEVICLEQPHSFRAVGMWYEDFGQTSDAVVVRLLEDAWRSHGGDHSAIPGDGSG